VVGPGDEEQDEASDAEDLCEGCDLDSSEEFAEFLSADGCCGDDQRSELSEGRRRRENIVRRRAKSRRKEGKVHKERGRLTV
jgi:hypothetical protein